MYVREMAAAHALGLTLAYLETASSEEATAAAPTQIELVAGDEATCRRLRVGVSAGAGVSAGGSGADCETLWRSGESPALLLVDILP